jgi:isocitrate dehydrogenase
VNFCQALEKVCVETVEEGKMTKDLAVCIYGDKVTADKYLTTEQFLEAINSNLQKKLNKM